jgi:hypothetical protein
MWVPDELFVPWLCCTYIHSIDFTTYRSDMQCLPPTGRLKDVIWCCCSLQAIGFIGLMDVCPCLFMFVQVRALDIMFILHAEHELNCSTAAARHLASSGVDVYTAMSGGWVGIT